MLWEISGVNWFYEVEYVFDLRKLAVGKNDHFMGPNNGHSHVLSCVTNNSTGNDVLVFSNKTLLVIAEVCKELSVFFKEPNRAFSWSCFINLENFFILEKASLSDENLKIVIHWEQHELPIDGVKHMCFGIKDLFISVPSLHHAVERISPWIFLLMVLGWDHETNYRNEKGIILSVNKRAIKVHNHDGMVYSLVLRL